MAWLGAIETGGLPCFHSEGMENGASINKISDRVLHSGTVILETCVPDAFRQPLDLIEIKSKSKTPRSLHVVFGPNGKLWFSTECGDFSTAALIDLSAWPKQTPLRMTYHWSTTDKRAVLGAENLDTGEIIVREFDRFLPLCLSDLARVLHKQNSPSRCDDVTAFCFADHLEPLGYTDGYDASAILQTETGPRPICEVSPGTLVITEGGNLAPILAVFERDLPNLGSMKMVELTRPYETLADILSLSQRSMLHTQGEDADYLFGHDRTHVYAYQVAPYVPAKSSHSGSIRKRYSLILEDNAFVQINGLCAGTAQIVHSQAAHRYTALSGLEYTEIHGGFSKRQTALAQHEATALFMQRYA